ncbi:UDP-3-O-(3-hydroxymyristoyl)glucosamine N-acyltransferase [Maricaulis sp.]|uniref:UDP-3-O-(3-hydroxymyristoyl)glucosamine N-acyltransferase n=1 Tax=Maricaulis sp. TaxID=1486257 RepID=UPI00260504B8|nr:UDP-3-O-(3-hydroxymyristoyl)glucosamine N-acyltransferase [Maricaulis sp.]
MADPRFYDRLGPRTITEIAALSDAAISDSGAGETTVDAVAPLGEASRGAVSYVESAKLLAAAEAADLDDAVILAPEALKDALVERGAIVLVHAAPRAGFAAIAASLFRPRRIAGPEAIDQSAKIAPDAVIAPNAVIGPDVEIGAGAWIGPGAHIGPGCRIGEGSVIGANASISCSDIGRECQILAGAVLGEAGFGVAVAGSTVIDIPHLGMVRLGDRVTIGANSCVDRAVFGETRLDDGVKLDNLCHIAHNVRVGRSVLMPAYAGVSGSTTIGDGVMFGGRVGISDHVEIGEGARIGSNSAVMNDVPAGETYAGAPAQPIRRHMREIAEIRRLVKSKDKSKKGG